MFTIEKANLANNGTFTEQSLAEAKLMDKSIKLSSKKNGLNFFDKDGSLFCFARFSKAVKQALIDKSLSVEQLLKFGKISMSVYDNGDGNGEQNYYSLTIPDALRGGVDLGVAKDIAAKAKPLAKVSVSIGDISKMLVLE